MQQSTAITNSLTRLALALMSGMSFLEAKITTNVSQITRNYRTTKFMENLWSIHDNSCLSGLEAKITTNVSQNRRFDEVNYQKLSDNKIHGKLVANS